MPAPKKNKNAQKWDRKKALEFIAMVNKRLRNRESYHIGRTCVEALDELRGIYPNISFQGGQIWSYLSDKFKEDEIVFEAIKKAETIAEGNIVEDTLKGALKSSSMAIFYLKNKHHYSDKTEQEVSVKGSIPIDRWIDQCFEAQ